MTLQRRTGLRRPVKPLLRLQHRCCGMKGFATEQEAEAALLRIARTTTRPESPQRAFKGTCGWWHLAKEPKAAADKPRTPLRPQSKKRQAENRVRKQVAHATFGSDPVCHRPGCSSWADDCHEPLTRARGGSITDPDNMVPLCRNCHMELEDEPPWAYDIGLLIHSWDKDGAA